MEAQADVLHLAKVLAFVARRNEGAKELSAHQAMFTLPAAFQTPLVALVERLSSTIRCSPVCYPAALVYIDRITKLSPDLSVNPATVHMLFAIALLVAHQYLDDNHELCARFGLALGLPVSHIANLKTSFVCLLQFELGLPAEEVAAYGCQLKGRFALDALGTDPAAGAAPVVPVVPSLPRRRSSC